METIGDLIKEVAACNIGALSVCYGLVERFEEQSAIDLAICLQDGITGPEVWCLYKNCCESDLHAFHNALLHDTARELLESGTDSKFYVKEQDGHTAHH